MTVISPQRSVEIIQIHPITYDTVDRSIRTQFRIGHTKLQQIAVHA